MPRARFVAVLRFWLLTVVAALLPAAGWAAVSVDWLKAAPSGMDMAQAARLGDSALTRLPAGAINAGYVGQPHWFRLHVDPVAGVQAGVLVIDNPLLDEVDIQILSGPEQGRRIQLGASRPFAQRLVRATAFRVPMKLDAAQPTELLVRVATRTAMQLTLGFETPHEAQAAERGFLVLNGVLSGVMLAMAAYNLCLLASTRDRAYLWYIGWVLAMGLFSASVVGLAYEWLWPGSPHWNAISRPVLLSLAVAFAMMFARDFIGVRQLHPAAAGAIASLGVAGLLRAAISLAMPYALAIKVAIGIAVGAMVIAPLGALWAWRQGSQAAGYYVLAWTFVVVGGTVLAADKLGLLPSTMITQHASQIGAAIESVVLSFALAARLNAERLLRERAQIQAERSQAEARRLGDLSERDGLTGLYNRRRLESQLDALAGTWRESGDLLTVMMVDIDHFKRLNDTHGHAAGDACIRAVAQVLQEHARREHDLAARYGGEEFCLVLPGLPPRLAQQRAEAIRQAIESLRVAHRGEELRLSASIGVAVNDTDMRPDPRQLLGLADSALYAAKAGGRNRCVCQLTSAQGDGRLVEAGLAMDSVQPSALRQAELQSGPAD